jgi:hypothetical protein
MARSVVLALLVALLCLAAAHPANAKVDKTPNDDSLYLVTSSTEKSADAAQPRCCIAQRSTPCADLCAFRHV